MFYALIGDMVDSRRLSSEERNEAQKLLRNELDQLNRAWADQIASKFLITLGDECQGLMLITGDPVTAALGLIHAFLPYRIRFAIGCGDIHAAINPEAAIGADGPAFHHARRVIDKMKKDHNARLRFALSDTKKEEELNTIAMLCDRLANQWTSKQEDLVFTMLNARISGLRMTQMELSKIKGIGQSTVAAQLNSAGFNEYLTGIQLIRKWLSIITSQS